MGEGVNSKRGRVQIMGQKGRCLCHLIMHGEHSEDEWVDG